MISKVLYLCKDVTQWDSCDAIQQTDKFEKLFKVYANLVKVPLEKMVFRFDGDQISHNSTPKELDLEDNDVVEVYIKS